MLNGIDPIILFNFKKNIPSLFTTSIPLVANREFTVTLPTIPIYLSERLTGLYIDTEDKNIDIDTTIDSKTNGADPDINQKTLNSSVKINITAKRGSIGAALMAAMMELVFPKVTSKEYTISYFHGTVIIFDGLLHSYSSNQQSGTDLYTISLEIVTAGSAAKAAIAVVSKNTGALPIG